MGSVVSPLAFLSYKIDNVTLETKTTLGVLTKEFSSKDNWKCSVAFRKPMYLEQENIYIGGMNARFTCGEKDSLDVKIEAGISGAFRLEAGILPQETEEKLVKYQLPALLFPYLRATITSLAANAGLGSIIFPVINIHELAKEHLKDLTLEKIKNEHN